MDAARQKIVKILCPAAQAKPSPKIGQALGSVGVNMMQFCKQFNDVTTKYKPGIPLPVEVIANEDRSFLFHVKLPTSAYFLKAAAKVPRGAHQTGHEVVGYIHVKQVYELARMQKANNPNYASFELRSIARSLVATARSMGIKTYTGLYKGPPPLSDKYAPLSKSAKFQQK